MPNWCYNTLEVRGQIEDVQKFFEHAKRAVPQSDHVLSAECSLDFNKFIPMPPEVRLTPKTYELGETIEERQEKWKCTINAIDWAVDNWDTKWNAHDVTCHTNDDDKGYLLYDFNTAWSPPMAVFNKMAEMFPTLKFHATYQGEGNEYYGESGWKKGVLLFEREITPSDSSWMNEEDEEEKS
jgi:hypothetical protein